MFYGLDWVATVPPTVALCRSHFGLEKSGVVFGWVFAAHMVGAGVAASYAGWIRQGTGDYFIAWMTAGGLCLLAAVMCLSIPRVHAVTRSESARSRLRSDETVGPRCAAPITRAGLRRSPWLRHVLLRLARHALTARMHDPLTYSSG